MFGIILAGGSGSRLWPLSRELYPKQLLNLNSDKSLLQATFDRLAGYISQDKILCITNTRHSSNVKMQLAALTANPCILSEPISRNTAGAIAVSTKFVMQNFDEDEVIIVVPSDHQIKDTTKFISTVKKAESLAKQGYIVTLGIKPNYSETGYGYIHAFDELGQGFKVKEFVEKPDLKTAEEYLKEGGYYWNSGIFMFKASTMMSAFEKLAPEIYEITKNIDFSNSSEIPYLEFEKMPNISIDYAIMEKSDNIALVELESDWNDLGSWQAIYDTGKKDENGNVLVGHVIDQALKNSFVYSSSKLVAAIGLEDTVIVETEDAILACKKDHAQEVKQVYETLKKQNDDTHLVHKKVYRPWGFYKVIAQGEGYQSKIIHVNQGQKLSVQSHNHRSEHWVLLSGKADVLLDDKIHTLLPGQSVDIAVKEIHSLQNPYDTDLEIIEVQKGDILSEDDIIRYEDMYGRV